MNSRPNLKAILLIVGVSTMSACATTGDQRGRAPEAKTAGQPVQGAAGGTRPESSTRSESALDNFFRSADESSRYGGR